MRAILLAGLAAVLVSRPARADVRPQDQLWVINSRALGGSSTEKIAERLAYHRYQPKTNGWVASNLAGFMAEPADMTTCFLVPGNYYTHAEAIRVGWYAYHRLVGQTTDQRPLRYVIWSWPADPVPGRRLLDARIKFGRLDVGALHMASLLDQFDRSTPVSLVGSSFGAGIIVGALHLLGGGSLGPYRLTGGDRQPHHVKAVLIAAAFDNDWLMAGHKYELAMTQAERMLIFVNHRDLPLFFYKRLYFRRSRARALGREGPACLGCVIDGHKIELFNSHPWLGHHHGVRPYFEATGLVNKMRPYLLMWPHAATPAKDMSVFSSAKERRFVPAKGGDKSPGWQASISGSVLKVCCRTNGGWLGQRLADAPAIRTGASLTLCPSHRLRSDGGNTTLRHYPITHLTPSALAH